MDKEILKVTKKLGEALVLEFELRQHEKNIKLALIAAHKNTNIIRDELRDLELGITHSDSVETMLQYGHGRSTTPKRQTEEKETSLTEEVEKGSGYSDAEDWKTKVSELTTWWNNRGHAPLDSKKRISISEIQLGKSNTTNKRPALQTPRIGRRRSVRGDTKSKGRD